MQPDDPFPLEIVPSPVRHAMREVFKGRWPSIQEVAEVPDAYWLATPAIGRKYLQTIRAVSQAPDTDAADLPRLTDAELLERLESLRRELQLLRTMVKARMRRSVRSGKSFERRAGRAPRPTGSLAGQTWPQRANEGLAM